MLPLANHPKYYSSGYLLFEVRQYISVYYGTPVPKKAKGKRRMKSKYYEQNKEKILQSRNVPAATRDKKNKEAYVAHKKSIRHSRRKRYSLISKEKEARVAHYSSEAEKEKAACRERYQSEPGKDKAARRERYRSERGKERTARRERYQ